MQKKAVIVGLTVALFSSASYALDPIGPTKALQGQKHWSLGLEGAYGQTRTELDDFDMSSQLRENKAYVNLRYGVYEDIDVFGRLGLVAFEEDSFQDGDADLAFGFGAAATLRDKEKIDWGVLAQLSRGRSSSVGMDSEVEAWSFQVAGGPTYQIRDDMAVYGGLFFYMLDGELEVGPFDTDMEEEDPFGLFAGIDCTVKEDMRWTLEFQWAGDTLAVTTGLYWTVK